MSALNLVYIGELLVNRNIEQPIAFCHSAFVLCDKLIPFQSGTVPLTRLIKSATHRTYIQGRVPINSVCAKRYAAQPVIKVFLQGWGISRTLARRNEVKCGTTIAPCPDEERLV